jgi:hypothetical protein
VRAPTFTASAAVDDRDRLVLQVDDGKHLAYGKRARVDASWVTESVVAARRRGADLELELELKGRPHPRVCILDVSELPEPTIAALETTPTLEQLSGPLTSAAIRLAPFGVVGLGEIRALSFTERRRRQKAAIR